jgi:hypothetical protein
MIMKIFTIGLIIISVLVMSSIALTTPTALQASSKGLKLYLTVDRARPNKALGNRTRACCPPFMGRIKLTNFTGCYL